MSKIEKSILILDSLENGRTYSWMRVDPRANLIVTVIFLCLMLGVPSEHIDILLWFSLYPIIASPLMGLTYSSIFLQSLIVLPLVLLLGMFNPIIDHSVVVTAGGIKITRGWLTFIGLILRGLLSMQALLILIRSAGFTGVVRSMERLGVPKFLTTQLLMVFRYIKVLLEEGYEMKRARDARSFGRKQLPIKLWGVLIGQLFIRSVDRAERVHRAMLARGFSGEMPYLESSRTPWRTSDTLYVAVWTLALVFLRLFNLSLLFVS